MDSTRPGPRGRSLAIILVLVATGFVGLLGAAPPAAAATTHFLAGSACKSTSTPVWLSGDTWVLYGNALVDAGCTLTIQPNVTVLGDPGVHLYVNGTLHADGLDGAPISFLNNQTTATPWAGVQFDSGSSGSVAWAEFDRVQVAVTAQSSSPTISNNTILLASAAVRLDSSSSPVLDNEIDGRGVGALGIILSSSTASLVGNTINGTVIGIEATTAGSPVIRDNRITNVSGTFALGMFIDHQSSVNITGNLLQYILAKDAASGGQGGSAAAILVNATSSVSIWQNTVDTVRGGRGGNGAPATVGGNPGGNGGSAAGIGVGAASTVSLGGNMLSTITGGHGGDGSGSTTAGGAGGVGGFAIGIELFSASGNVAFLSNTITGATGGGGGAGGQSGTNLVPDGPGGAGSDVYGIFSLGGLNAVLRGNTVLTLAGGAGGATPTGPSSFGIGGSGGNATGLIAVIQGTVTFDANQVNSVVGGVGGDGFTLGGFGGNATGVLALGTSAGFNSTSVSGNTISTITGGAGGVGRTLSGDGGNVTGFTALHVNASLASNHVSFIQGGAGGLPYKGTNLASGGGNAGAVALFEVPSGSSFQDVIQSVMGGAAGGTVSPPFSRGVGYYLIGTRDTHTSVGVTNGTISSTQSDDFYVDNYTAATALNTSFSASKVAVMPAANLTVRNFLAVKALWPNGVTAVWGARVAVRDNGVETYNRTTPLGVANWIVVTNQVYIEGPVPTWNVTRVSVSYQSYIFANSPRNVNLTSSQTQSFTMVDTTAPTSSASALPTWTTARTFSVYFTSNDFFGVGVANVTLWYRLNGTAWVAYNTTSSLFLGGGQFGFTASSDGTYEFATTAVDKAGNRQQPYPPAANDTWTIVDTIAPRSHVVILPRYETSAMFTVRWGPDTGVTDIASYTIQVSTGSGWMDWLPDTTATSASYTSAVQGPIAFRAIARDFAGNQESKLGNDTWTIVDTIAPQVVSRTPTGNLTLSPVAIVVTFSEAMNTTSVEAAFQISPTANTTYTWTNGGQSLVVTFGQPLALGTTYTVTVGTGAQDLAGNSLAQPSVFTFATPPPPAGLSLTDLWPLFVVIAAVLVALVVFFVRRRGSAAAEAVPAPAAPASTAPPVASPAKTEAAIDDIFLLYQRDGVLIKHETRRLRPDIDSDILSGMLNAVQQFVKDALLGSEGDELSEMVLGQMHILIGRGKWLVLAATITGGDMASMNLQIQRCIQDMEDHNWDRLEDWDGDMELAKFLSPCLKKLIRGEYA